MAFSNKWVAFGVGVAAGVAAVALVKNPAFKKACAAVVGKGLQLKDDACAFAESVKEDAQESEKKCSADYKNIRRIEQRKINQLEIDKIDHIPPEHPVDQIAGRTGKDPDDTDTHR